MQPIEMPSQWVGRGSAGSSASLQMFPTVPVPVAPMAGAIRPRGPSKPPRPLKEGDWECPEPSCGNINFSKRTKCNRCGIPKPRPVVDNASIPHLGGPPGLFKQGDWPCPQCGNVNWARREKCNICNAAKPSLKTKEKEPRTGRGGGHFDLQDPADRNEYHSDNEEYDEFGRKKKRKNTCSNNSSGQNSGNHLSNFSQVSSSFTNKNNTVDPPIKLAFPPAPKSDEESSSSSSDSSRSSSCYASKKKGGAEREKYRQRTKERERQQEKEREREKRRKAKERRRSRSRSCTLSRDGHYS